MVFIRASTGCGECRIRHTKCDNASPSCGRCLRRGIVCPGYRHVGGFVFKPHTNCTQETRKCLQRPRTTRDALVQVHDVEFRDPYRFITFFFDTYVFAGRCSDSSCGLLDHASMLCRQASPSSTLVKAAHVLGATTYILSRRHDGEDLSWYHESRLGAIQSMHRDIQCRKSRIRDDTLLAVLLLDLAEAIVRGHMGSKRPFSHQHGALALLKLRGSLNFKTVEARSLYNAARYATLRGNVRSPETTSTLQTLDLLAPLGEVDQPPALRLLDTLDQINGLQCAIEAAALSGNSFNHLYSLAIEAQISLDAWIDYLPPNWLPCTVRFQPPAQSSNLLLIEQYESMDIAVVYNLWRCACLRMKRLHQALSQITLPHPQPVEDGTEQIFNGIRRAVPVFLGWLHGPDCVEQDATTGVWRQASHHRNKPNVQRFPGDYLGKWFLSDLLGRLEQTIGDCDDILPQLHVSSETMLFLREQKQVISDLSLSSTQQLGQVFFECASVA